MNLDSVIQILINCSTPLYNVLSIHSDALRCKSGAEFGSFYEAVEKHNDDKQR